MKVSVAMISYNHERFIAQALESVLRQRVNFPYEIVIGDDHSTDATASIIADFRQRHPDKIVPFLREQNVGGSRNIELVLAACRGEYVAMLEGDDYWTFEDKLQSQVDFLDAHPDFAMSCHRVQILNETVDNRAGLFPQAAGSYTLEDLLRGNFIMTCTALFRRNALTPLPARMQKMSPLDWARFIVIATHGKIAFMDDVMAAYRVHFGSTWSALPTETRLRESARMLSTLSKHLGPEYADLIRNTAARPFLIKAVAAQANGRRAEAAGHLVKCLRYGGWYLPGCRRTLAAVAAYSLLGSRYKLISGLKAVIPE